MKNAWYSSKMALRTGTFWYSRPDGTEVECTEVGSRTQHRLGWDDVGSVVKFLRRGLYPATMFEVKNDIGRMD